MYYILTSVFLLSLTILFGYLVYRFHKTIIIKFIKNKKASKILLLFIFIITLIFVIFDTINTLLVFVSLFLFLLIYDFIIGIINIIRKKDINNSISFILAIITTCIYLIYGYYLAHHVVETDYIIETNKDIGVDKFRIVQVTDSHIGSTMDGVDFYKYMKDINKLNPDIVVMTGDFVDDDTKLKDMIKSCEGLGLLDTKYGVYFIYGNHDKAYFNYRNFDDKRLRKELKKNNVIILEDDVRLITDNIYLVGRQDSQEKDRLSAEELSSNLDKSKYIIGLDHKPTDYGNLVNAGFDLVLSGHTHGGQLWPVGQLSVFMGINDNNYGLKTIDEANFIVSSGIGDWTIKFKMGTISEYVVIDLINKK